jgi:Domain of Unknown Function with PDB structure (DUF3862)
MKKSIFALAICLSLVACSKVPPTKENEVNMTAFSQIKTGMSYAQAVKVLKTEGKELSRGKIGNIETVMYMWEGNSLGGNMNLMFQNDKLITKSQFGLK